VGAEAKTTGVIDGRQYPGTLLLESDYLLFRSPPDFRWKLALTEAHELSVCDGHLVVNGHARFALGDAAAAKWIDKIRNPKSLIDKLGVKAEHRVGFAGPVPEDFAATLAGRLNNPATSRLKQNLDIVFAFLETPADLGRIQQARDAIAANGMIWLVYPKGGKTIKESQVRQATFSLGLVDVKVAGFSATLTAVKVVIPVMERKSNLR
jgi:hypothetical protein